MEYLNEPVRQYGFDSPERSLKQAEPPLGIRLITCFIEGNYFYILSALLMMAGCYLLQQTTDSEATFEYDLKALLILQGYEFLLIATALLIFRRLKVLGDAFTLLILELVLLLDPTFFSNAFFTLTQIPNYQPPFDMVWINTACFVLVPLKLGILIKFLKLPVSGRMLVAFGFAGAVVYLGEGPLNQLGEAFSRYDYYYILSWAPALLVLLLPPLRNMAPSEHIGYRILSPRQATWLPRLLLILSAGAVTAHIIESSFVYLTVYLPLYLAPLAVAVCLLLINNARQGVRDIIYLIDCILLLALLFSMPKANPIDELFRETRLLTAPSFVVSGWPFFIAVVAAVGIYAGFFRRLQYRPSIYRIIIIGLALLIYWFTISGWTERGVHGSAALFKWITGLVWAHPSLILMPVYMFLILLAVRIRHYLTWMAAGAFTLFLFFYYTPLEIRFWIPETIQVSMLFLLVLGHVFHSTGEERRFLSALVAVAALVRVIESRAPWAAAVLGIEAVGFVIAGIQLKQRCYCVIGGIQGIGLLAGAFWWLQKHISTALLVMAGGMVLFVIGVVVTFYKEALLRRINSGCGRVDCVDYLDDGDRL